MIEVEVTPEIIDKAEKSICHGDLKTNHDAPKANRNMIGYLGEAVFHYIFRHAKRVNNYDFDFLSKGQRVDVKSTLIPTSPKGYYLNSIYVKETCQDCDYYVFVQILADMTTAWLVGYLSKEDFLRRAGFHAKGSPALNSKTKTYDADSLTIRNYQLKELK